MFSHTRFGLFQILITFCVCRIMCKWVWEWVWIYVCVCVCVCKWNVLVGVLCACGKASVTMGSDTPKWPKRVSPNPRLSATINVHVHRFLTLGKYGDCVCFVLSFQCKPKITTLVVIWYVYLKKKTRKELQNNIFEFTKITNQLYCIYI